MSLPENFLIDSGSITFLLPPREGGEVSVQVIGHPCGADGRPASAEEIGAAYAERGMTSLAELDGAFGVILTDPSSGKVHVVTDRFNVIPLYIGEGKGQMAVGSHPDVLARHLGVETDFDLVTMAQAVHMWYATFPYTYYRALRELAPATVHTWDREGRHTARPYWEPAFRGDPAPDHDTLAEELAAAIREGVQRRVALSDRPGLLLSAGADSRGLLFSAAEEKPITCYTFGDLENAEVQQAARLAAAVGQRHVFLRRDPEHYGAHARESTRLMAGMWNFLDGHAVGFLPRFRAEGLDLLLSGDFADLLYKDAGLNLGYRQLFRKNLPIKRVAPFSVGWRTPRMKVSKALTSAIEARIEEQYAGIDTARLDEAGWWHVVHRRVGVISRTGSIGGPISLQRALPWDTFMADRAMASVYEQLTTGARVNASVWERAVKRLTPPAARSIPNNNWGAPVGASDAEKTVRFLYSVLYRKLFRRDVDGTPLGGAVTRGSWPNFGHYLAQSPVISQLWEPACGPAADVLREIMGTDPWAGEEREKLRRAGVGFGRVLTLKLWLEDRLGEAGAA